MGQSRQTIREITLAAGTDGRVWDAPSSLPFWNMHIWVTTRGVHVAAGTCTWEVFYGGGWGGDGGPFSLDATHLGGITQANGNLTLADEIVDHIHEDADYFPSNQPIVVPPQRTAPRPGGFPIVVEFDNTAGPDLSLVVTFVSQVESNLY
jgi:hypothetical protein